MKIDPVLMQIFRHRWAIDPDYAFKMAPVINGLVSGNVIDRDTQAEDSKLKAVISSKDNKPLKYYDWDEAPKDSIALIPINGELMKENYCGAPGMATLGKRIQEADNDPRFSGILLLVDSPGGTVDGTEVLSTIVKNTKKPVLTYVDGLMASAAAWIGSGANEIWTSTDTDEVGSIGVLMSFYDVIPAYEIQGFKFHLITASKSPDKVKMFQDLRAGRYEEYRETVLDVLDEKFMNAIKENRPKVSDEHLTGKVFFARDVMGILVDKVGTMEEAVERLYELSETNNTSQVAEEEEQDESTEITINANNTMEKLTLLMAAMAVSSIELDKEGYASLNEEQLQAIEDALKASADANTDLETQLETAQNDLQAAQDAEGTSTEELNNLRDANKQLREENDSLKKAAAGGSATSRINIDTTAEEKEKKEKEGVVTSDEKSYMENLDAICEERETML